MSVIPKTRASGKVTYYVETWWNKKAWREKAGTDKRQAERLDAQRKREVAAGTFEPTRKVVRKTVIGYAQDWGAERSNASASDDRRNLARFTSLPEFAALHLDDVRPRHVIAALKELAGSVAKKTLQNAYGTLRTMFRDAQIAEFVISNPCVLPRGYFADEQTKEREAYTRTEVAVLLAHHQIPEPIRVLLALCVLGGMREGEACGRKWSDLDQEPQPLWALDVGSQYGGRALKTKKRRVVPVHPELQEILVRWGSVGFTELTGHAPRPEDYIVPNISPRANSAHHTKSTFYKAFRKALVATGIPNKTLHSTRHTMITLARRGGGDKAVVSKVTHNAKGDIVDRYTHRDWSELCAAVLAIGSLSAARMTPHPPAGSSGKLASHVPGEIDMNSRELPRSVGADPSSIPGASTLDSHKSSLALGPRQSPRQCSNGSTDVDPDPEGEEFAAALVEQADRARPTELARVVRASSVTRRSGKESA